MSYPIKYRERAIEYRREGHTLEETKATFKVSISTIRKWERQLKEKGELRPKTLTRKPKKIEPEKLRAYVAEHPDAYQREIAWEFNCTQSAVQKALKRLKITRKKATTYEEQSYDKVAEYKYEIADIPPENIAYVDETGIDCYLYREYGYGPRGQLVHDRIKGRKYMRTSIVAAQMGNEIIAPCQYTGTMNHEWFEKWFQEHLLSALPKGTVIVMDNASFHRKEQLYSLAQKSGCYLIFLPPYSPELNPIEHFWAWLKRTLRRILPKLVSLDQAIFAAFFFRKQLTSD